MNKKVWIIKEGSEIFGPFNQEEVIARINNQEVQAIDQIASSFSKFQLMKNSQEFGLLFQISETRNDRDEQQTLSSTATTTEAVDPSVTGFFDIKVKTPASTPKSLEEKNYRKSFKQIPTPVHTKDSLDQLHPVDLGHNRKILKKASLVICGLFVIAGFYVYYYLQHQRMAKENQRTQEKKQATFLQREEAFLSAIEAKILGNYGDARSLLQRILQLQPDRFEASFHLVEIDILERNDVQARRRLNQMLQSVNSFHSRVNNYLALIALQNSDFKEAEKYLKTALEHDSAFTPALVNQGTFYFFQESYIQAEDSYALAALTNPREGILMLHRVSNAVEYYLETGDQALLERLLDPLREYSNTTYDFKLEASLMFALVQFLLNHTQEAKRLLKHILQLDLDLTNQHVHDMQYHQGSLFWDNIMTWFQDFDEWETDSDLLAVYGFLTFRGDRDEGQRLIQEALALDKNNHKILTLQAYIQNILEPESSNPHLDLAQRADPLFGLPILLKARICEQEKNYFCTAHYWKQLAIQSLFPLQTLTGLAWTSEREDNRQQAKQRFEKAKQLSKNYRPLLLLEIKWNKEMNL